MALKFCSKNLFLIAIFMLDQMGNWGVYLTYQSIPGSHVLLESLSPYLLQCLADIPTPYFELTNPGAGLIFPCGSSLYNPTITVPWSFSVYPYSSGQSYPSCLFLFFLLSPSSNLRFPFSFICTCHVSRLCT